MRSIVPVVDISGWASGSPDERAGVASAVDAACRDVGFLQVTGHGIADAVVADVLAAMDEYFDLPLAEKVETSTPRPDVNRGYAGIGEESLAYSLGVEAPPDLFEAYNIGPDEIAPALLELEHELGELPGIVARNVWPERPSAFRPAMVAYFEAAEAVSHRMCEIFAVALGLPERFFDDYLDHPIETMRGISYRRRPGEPDPVGGQMRLGAHTDYGIVTVLYADPVPGLQLVGPDGGWHDVVPEPGALLINLGDLTAQWTNDRWRSTIHRVAPPPRHVDGESRRRSIAFFQDGDHDAVVSVLPTCIDADHPARYEPVTIGDHLTAKVVAGRAQEKSTAVDTVGERIAAIARSI